MPLPFDYQYWLYSMLLDRLKNADGDLADFLHSHTGYKYYTFSWILSEEMKPKNSGLIFRNGHFYLSSPDKKFIEGFASGLLQQPEFNLGHTEFEIDSVEILDKKKIKSKMVFNTLSPVYTKTTRDEEGEWDLLPLRNPKWHENIHNNLLKRYKEYYGEEPPKGNFEIKRFLKKPEYKRVTMTKEVNGESKKFHRRCARFKFEVIGDPELLKLGYEAGFGQNTATGFGCVEVIDDA